MASNGTSRVESESIRDFALVMQQDDRIQPRASRDATPQRVRLELDPDHVKNGLGQLVLTLVKLLHEVLERQAIRRIDAGSLTAEQVERLGVTLMRQAEEIERMRREFGLEQEDLDIDLAQQAVTHAMQSSTLSDVLERVLDKGVVIAGDIKIKLVDIELLSIQIRLVICSVDKAKEMGMDWWVNNPIFCSQAPQGNLEASLSRIDERLAKIEAREAVLA
jgi:hypothetical protein